MNKDKKPSLSIILLERDRLEFFSPSIPDILIFEFKKDLVNDLELLNQSGLELQLKAFINQYKIPQSELAIILSDSICFEKDNSDTDDTKQAAIVQNFLDIVPFENSGHKIFKLKKGYRIVAANKNLYRAINDALGNMGFTVIGVVPSSILGITIQNLDEASARFIAEKANLIKQQTMIAPEQEIIKGPTEEKKVFGVRRIIMLVAIFAVLISIMIYLLNNQAKENARIKQQELQKKTQGVIPETPVVTPETLQ